MTRYLSLATLLTGCVIVGPSAHEDRIRALTEAATPTDAPTPPPTDTGDTDDTDDTDPPTPVESPPVLDELDWSFRFNDLDLYQGLQLLVRGSDPNGDLAELQIQGGETIPWTHAVERADGWFLVPIALDLGPPCEPSGSADLNVFLRDFQGNASQPVQVQISWQGYLHDESSIQSSDACEPCVSGITLGEIPFAACGDKRSEGYADYFDAVQVLLSASAPTLQVTANYGPDAANLRLSQTLTGDTEFLQVVSGANTIGQTLFIEPPATATGYDLNIDGPTRFGFDEGSWTMFVQPQLPGPLPR